MDSRRATDVTRVSGQRDRECARNDGARESRGHRSVAKQERERARRVGVANHKAVLVDACGVGGRGIEHDRGGRRRFKRARCGGRVDGDRRADRTSERDRACEDGEGGGRPCERVVGRVTHPEAGGGREHARREVGREQRRVRAGDDAARSSVGDGGFHRSVVDTELDALLTCRALLRPRSQLVRAADRGVMHCLALHGRTRSSVRDACRAHGCGRARCVVGCVDGVVVRATASRRAKGLVRVDDEVGVLALDDGAPRVRRESPSVRERRPVECRGADQRLPVARLHRAQVVELHIVGHRKLARDDEKRVILRLRAAREVQVDKLLLEAHDALVSKWMPLRHRLSPPAAPLYVTRPVESMTTLLKPAVVQSPKTWDLRGR